MKKKYKKVVILLPEEEFKEHFSIEDGKMFLRFPGLWEMHHCGIRTEMNLKEINFIVWNYCETMEAIPF